MELVHRHGVGRVPQGHEPLLPDPPKALLGFLITNIIHEVLIACLNSRYPDPGVRSKAVKEQNPSDDQGPRAAWAFLTNHAHVLLCIARDPQSRARDIAERVGITERAAQRILADLIVEGYATRTKVGRRNHYKVNPQGHLRHPAILNVAIGDLLDVLTVAKPPSRDG